MDEMQMLREELKSESAWAKQYHDEIQELKAELSMSNERAERLIAASKGLGMPSEMNSMEEVVVLVLGLYERAEKAERERDMLRLSVTKLSKKLRIKNDRQN